MNIIGYMKYFESVSNAAPPVPPYDNPDYINYSRLNWVRQKRWLTNGKLNEELLDMIATIEGQQKWVLITEPWCGDAPHILPFIWNFSAVNKNIELDIQLRDAYPFQIEQYLSGTKRSIPKLIVRNEDDRDLFVWGPRPKDCQQLRDALHAEGIAHEQINITLQNWYNHDRGVSFQMELLALFRKVFAKLN